MLKDITLGQFFPGSSLLHRLDPRAKLPAYGSADAAGAALPSWPTANTASPPMRQARPSRTPHSRHTMHRSAKFDFKSFIGTVLLPCDCNAPVKWVDESR